MLFAQVCIVCGDTLHYRVGHTAMEGGSEMDLMEVSKNYTIRLDKVLYLYSRL